jgi:hypothetical protein
VYNYGGGTFNLRSTVVAGNILNRETFWDDDCAGALGSYGRNKFWRLCTITQNGVGDYTLLGSLSELAPLANNGGPTRTHAIVAPSDMIDGAEPIFGCRDKTGSVILADQRGFARSVGVRCDIGSFELGASDPSLIFVDGFESGDLSAW